MYITVFKITKPVPECKLMFIQIYLIKKYDTYYDFTNISSNIFNFLYAAHLKHHYPICSTYLNLITKTLTHIKQLVSDNMIFHSEATRQAIWSWIHFKLWGNKYQSHILLLMVFFYSKIYILEELVYVSVPSTLIFRRVLLYTQQADAILKKMKQNRRTVEKTDKFPTSQLCFVFDS